jgi:2,4-dienoyl-CoA reductase-like NADH-dependent reductase (Old Yellow Enzyme family)/NADPH-dependent 2,4-dienoyl-CoA reductase/sulfur reductase-like enzyme
VDKLDQLFKPSKIGSMTLANRVIMAPMFTQIAAEKGYVSDRLCAYYEERARGGMGLIIVENTAVARGGESATREPAIFDDTYLDGLSRLASVIHKYGVKAAIQLHHAGRQRPAQMGEPVAPSAIACKFVKAQPRALTTEEADELVEKYAEGALRAKKAGFDAVEFHGAHGYLICQFLSAYTNKRTDKYGGSLEARMRFALDIVKKTRQKVGSGFPVLFRISAKEFVPEGLDLDQTKLIARALQDAGVDCIDVSAGIYETGQWSCQPGWMPRGCLVPFAEEIKKNVSVPVIVAGRMVDPRFADKVLLEGKADFIALGRPFLTDPQILIKAKKGRYGDIRMCIACCNCMDSLMRGKPIVCSINAELGRETSKPLPAKIPKKVVVVGGGPGGMEAARVAAGRGHKVSLYEKDKAPGGQLIIAALPPGKEELQTTILFLTAQLDKEGVDVHLGHAVTAQEIIDLHPDVVIIAAGSVTERPNLSGADLPHVLLARDVLSGKVQTGRKVVVVGGGRVGCETAELLVRQGKDVTLVRMSGKSRLAQEIGPASRGSFLEKLAKSGVKIKATAVISDIDRKAVMVSESGVTTHIEADTVILSPAPIADDGIARLLEGKIPEIIVIGDCAKPRAIIDAIHEGYAAGSGI